MTLRNLARFGLAVLLLTGLVAGGVHAKAESVQLRIVSAS